MGFTGQMTEPSVSKH